MKKVTLSMLIIITILGIILSGLGGITLAAAPLEVQLPDEFPDDLAQRCETDWNVAINEAAANAYGLTVTEVVDGLHQGAVLKELADNQVEISKLQRELIDIRSQKIDQAVASGLITDEQASKIKVALPFVTNQLIENGGGPYWGNGLAGGKRWGVWRDDMATLLDMDVETLAAALNEGQSLGEIADTQDVGSDAVAAVLLTMVEEKLEVVIEKGFINQEMADTLLDFVAENISKLIYSNGPCSLDLDDLGLEELNLDDFPLAQKILQSAPTK